MIYYTVMDMAQEWIFKDVDTKSKTEHEEQFKCHVHYGTVGEQEKNGSSPFILGFREIKQGSIL